MLDHQGRSDFGALQKAFADRGGLSASGDVILWAFALLYLDGQGLTRMGLRERCDKPCQKFPQLTAC